MTHTTCSSIGLAVLWAAMVGLAVLTVAPAWAGQNAQRKIPFPKALDQAAVVQEQMATSAQHAMILGNGDINGLLHADGGGLVLRLTKNDVWDARLDSKLDPPLPTIKRIKEITASGKFGVGNILPEGSTWRGPSSYQAHPYPCPRACAVVRIGTGSARPMWRCIRRLGRRNAFERRGEAAVMSIEGKPGASNGYCLAPLTLTTDQYPRLRVKISGTSNAKFFISVKGSGNKTIFSSKWIVTPTVSKDHTFDLPAGKKVSSLVLYTWTTDGKRAENRFGKVTFEGAKGKFPIDLSLSPPKTRSVKLDIRRAVANVLGMKKAHGPETQVRALAGRNVFLIHTADSVTLEGVKSADIEAFSTGRRDGVHWVTQDLPGDEDWPGMRFAIALSADSKTNRKAVAIVTSREAKDPLATAVALARQTLKGDPASVIASHEARWRRFWSASGVDLGKGLLGETWYRNLYFLRCVTKSGVVCPGLFAGLIGDKPAWHGDYHTNYNIQQTFWTAYVTNHPELAEPYDRLVSEYLPRARWLARKVFDCRGAYYPHTLIAYEPPDPAKCKSPNGRQRIHHIWGFTQGVNGFTAQPLWWHYKYAPNRDLLAKVVYPVIRDVAIFQADFADTCKRDRFGKVVLGPSVSPEHWGWTKGFARNMNGTFDIAMFRYIFKAAIEGAVTLRRDKKLIARWSKALAALPDYPVTKGPNPVVVDMQGAPPITYNITVPAVPVFPADVVTWWSPQNQKALFARTIGSLRWNGNNSSIMLSVARARLSMPGTAEWVRKTLAARYRPNGTFGLNVVGSGINAYGHYTEQFASTMAVSELLIQSVGDIIRIFPAWPKDTPAQFVDLRTQGGFLVSASQTDGEVRELRIVATVGGKLRLLSPWRAIAVSRNGVRSVPLKRDVRGIVELDTSGGEQLVFTAR
ncbi:MAG: hypothetical protein HN350_18655 [Phycisphaerales bacterium]|jgi:hypothetical protein|nr:hypothetical protein [Phycisphaerales bacterium]